MSRPGFRRSVVRAIGSLFLAGLVLHPAVFASEMAAAQAGDSLSLDGTWDTGLDRDCRGHSPVPGLAEDPGAMSPGTLWYRRDVVLPAGDWARATLTLGGARFAPAIWIDGQKVSAAEGGMAPTELALPPALVRPGRTVRLEVALQSLRDLNPQDASAVPAADRWRSDISSSLWDHVALHFSGATRIARVIPWNDMANDRVAVHWDLDGGETPSRTIGARILDQSGKVVATAATTAATEDRGIIEIPLHHACQAWQPDTPECYRLELTVSEGGRVQDHRTVTWGWRDFRTQGKQFSLNGAPIHLRAGTVVWHRWLRDPEARTLGFDPVWFEHNIIQRLRALGANTLRFHLGLPPESFLDLCDRDGMMVQLEWPFFHGVKASPSSMQAQWREWLDVAMHHPSVMLIHPWNETEGDELKLAWSALDAILPEYPPLVIAHRDVIHIHKYWWSLFENLGLYYDSADQFDEPIMVDEFGGNYIDGAGNPGLYPTVRESFLRFLGREPTRELRLQLQTESNARVAEYWRRLNAAGFSPFCILSSPEDGNHWFLGPLAHPEPKPVWAALSAAYAPRSVSLEVWDRNFVPGQTVTLPLYYFNDTDQAATLESEIRVVAPGNATKKYSAKRNREYVPAHGEKVVSVVLTLPSSVGDWRLEAALLNPIDSASRTFPGVPATGFPATPVISSWRCRTLAVAVPEALAHARISVPESETELRALLQQNGLAAAPLDDATAPVIAVSTTTWAALEKNPALARQLERAVESGRSVVLLDVGPRDLGQGYKAGDLGPLDGAPRIATPRVEHRTLFSGVEVVFTEAPEPESHLHPAEHDDSLWSAMPRQSTWLWNGLRGGLIVPAEEMEVNGLSADAFVTLWQGRGGDPAAIRGKGSYYAYELAGFYAFSKDAKDKAVIAQLRAKVKFLAEDAPALQDRVNPNAPVEGVDLAAAYRKSGYTGRATQLVPLANCGKNLTRIPIVELAFGPGQGRVILSQVLTAGRLRRGAAEPGLYGLRYDPAAEQFTLNLLSRALAHHVAP